MATEDQKIENISSKHLRHLGIKNPKRAVLKNEESPMLERTDLIGALTAHVIFISSILTFLSRMIFKIGSGHWVGVPFLLMVFPHGTVISLLDYFSFFIIIFLKLKSKT